MWYNDTHTPCITDVLLEQPWGAADSAWSWWRSPDFASDGDVSPPTKPG